MSAPGSNPFSFSYMSQQPPNMDPSVAAALYHQQAHQQPGLSGPPPAFLPPPPPSQPTPVSDTSLDSPDPVRGTSVGNASTKRPARETDASRKKTKLDHDGDYDEDESSGPGGSNAPQKVKQTRGSRWDLVLFETRSVQLISSPHRACTVCRRLKVFNQSELSISHSF